MAYVIVNNDATINIQGSGDNRVVVKSNVLDVKAEDNNIVIYELNKQPLKIPYTEVSSPVFATAKDGQDYVASILGVILGGIATITGTVNRITVTSGSNPVIDIAATYVGQTSITTLGTIATGTWQGTVIAKQYGGTGVNIASAALVLGTASATAGQLSFNNATNAFTQTIRGTNPAASIIYDLPTTAPTLGQTLTATAPAAGIVTLSWSTISSGITGSGTANYVPYFSAATVVTANQNFQWNNTAQSLELGMGAPATFGADYHRLHIQINSNGTRELIRLENTSNVGTEGCEIFFIAGASTGLGYIDCRRDRFDIYSNQVIQIYNTTVGAASCLLINTSNLVMAGSSTALTSTRLGAKGTSSANTAYAIGATNAANTNLMRLTNLGCFLLGSTTNAPDATATYTIQIENGTAPAASQANTFSLYSADIVAGNAAAHFRTENGGIVKLYQETTAVAAGTVSHVGGTAWQENDTVDGYTIQQVVKALRNQGLLA